jgi:dihydrofolate reductase
LRRVINSTYVSLDGLIELLDRWHFCSGTGLLDELRLWVHPVLVGAGGLGDMLFREGNSARLRLAGTRPLASGVVVLSYHPQL